MSTKTAREKWKEYCESEIKSVRPILDELGFTIDEKQPHIQGERFIMQAVTTARGRKLILLGKEKKDNKKVVIKVSNEKDGVDEIEKERICREILKKINFAYDTFSSTKELVFTKQNDYLIFIQEFIQNDCTFIERPTEEQFSIALKAFKSQESAHATTYKHIKLIKDVYEVRNSNTYVENFSLFKDNIKKLITTNTELHKVLDDAYEEILNNRLIIEQYCGFLTHTDFVPHNIRIKDNLMYLLDHSSLVFGNKYEGWARFINFMTLYNPELQRALEKYVLDNRSEEEVMALHLMRIYRLGEIIYYYTDKISQCEGNLMKLSEVRVNFWKTILAHVIQNKEVTEEVINEYKDTRDSLRSDEEKERQKGLH